MLYCYSAIINPIEMIANLWDSAHQAYHAKRYEQALKQLEACLVLETSNAAVRASLLGRRGRIRYKVGTKASAILARADFLSFYRRTRSLSPNKTSTKRSRLTQCVPRPSR